MSKKAPPKDSYPKDGYDDCDCSLIGDVKILNDFLNSSFDDNTVVFDDVVTIGDIDVL
ncbi:MAG TPA: hypothetical protein VHG30_05655 [Microvirga sp.]|nr:hypothetical protein [Microvirga sp.]